MALARPINPYLFFIMEAHDLIEAGYPFEKNDLAYQEWLDVSYIKQNFGRRKDRANLREVSSEMLKLVKSSFIKS